MKNIFTSLLFVLVGLFIIWYSSKNKNVSETVLERGSRWQFIMAGIAFIAIGIISFLNDYNLW